MAGPRRYGTTKVAKAPGSRASTAGPAAAASAAEPRRIPLLTGERREIRVPNDGNNNNEQPYSERQPLLMRSGSDRKAAGGGRGGRGSGGNGDAAPAVFAAGSSRRDNTKVLTTLLVLNYMIGSGILNAPQVFQGSGIGSATILYIVAGMLHVLHATGTASSSSRSSSSDGSSSSSEKKKAAEARRTQSNNTQYAVRTADCYDSSCSSQEASRTTQAPVKQS